MPVRLVSPSTRPPVPTVKPCDEFNEEDGSFVSVYGWKMFQFQFTRSVDADTRWLYDAETGLGCVGHFEKDRNGRDYPFIYAWAMETRREGPCGHLQYAKTERPHVAVRFPILSDTDPDHLPTEELDSVIKEIEDECNSYLDKKMEYIPKLTKDVESQLAIQKSLPEIIITKEGVELDRCPSFMITPENRHLYPNLDYFMDLANSGDGLWSYFRPNEEGKLPAPSTWATDMNESYDSLHISNPKGLLPNFHELDVMINVFGKKLFGEIEYLDTRECEKNPPLGKIKFIWKNEILEKKTKLPPGWHRNLNKQKKKYYYWNEKDLISQWNDPWPTMIQDIQKNINVFREISENFSKTIHGNMDFKGHDFYELVKDVYAPSIHDKY